MSYSAIELATQQFYNWERLGRGYKLYPYTIDLEPPFQPFQRHTYYNYPSGYDDGKSPSLFKRIQKVLQPKAQSQEQDEANYAIDPIPQELDYTLKALRLRFLKPQHLNRSLSLELVQSLMYFNFPISFELIGNTDEITIQFVCHESESSRLKGLLQSYFPVVTVTEEDSFNLPFSTEKDIALCDFGLEEEFIRPLKFQDNFISDPLKNTFSTFDYLREDEVVMLQVIFKGISNPWSNNILHAVTDGTGNSFFVDAPEMLDLARKKTSEMLGACVVRLAVQANSDFRINALAREMIDNIAFATKSPHNQLMPLSNKGYNLNQHIVNLYKRQTNRLGMLLNANELLNLVHLPNDTINSTKLYQNIVKTKQPLRVSATGCLVGVNIHNRTETTIKLDHKERLKHTHIIGATGTGKTTLLANMVLNDVNTGLGLVLLDPHGDITDDVLLRIPEHRKNDVILIDPSDIDYPVGLNLLEAKSETEKIVLSSDLLSAFRQHATAWGDNMTAVFTNAVNTFLESNIKGTIIDLKRFLLEDKFREQFLKSVEDVSLKYYWQNEYKFVRKGITPLITRIDTFLRPKLLRHMFAQKSGINFNECIRDNKVVLVKLSQGLIGDANSFLLGSLLLAKVSQGIFSRQLLHKEQRHPFYVYIDEFQNFITPSISSILSGARKYGVGLILAHQDLSQITDQITLNAVLSNAFTRICFRLGDSDARRLESGFSFFNKEDFISLSVGEAIMKVGPSTNDFNLQTHLLTNTTNDEIKKHSIEQTRVLYATNRQDVDKILERLFSNQIENTISIPPKIDFGTTKTKDNEPEDNTLVHTNGQKEKIGITDKQRQKLVDQEIESKSQREHTFIQKAIKRLGQQHGFIASVEKEITNGARVDVLLENDENTIACEVSVTNKVEYELENIKKCLREHYDLILMISKQSDHLKRIEKYANEQLTKRELKNVRFIHPDQLIEVLTLNKQKTKPTTEIFKGYRVITDYEKDSEMDAKKIKANIFKRLMK